jgi:hypothetical protein
MLGFDLFRLNKCNIFYWVVGGGDRRDCWSGGENFGESLRWNTAPVGRMPISRGASSRNWVTPSQAKRTSFKALEERLRERCVVCYGAVLVNCGDDLLRYLMNHHGPLEPAVGPIGAESHHHLARSGYHGPQQRLEKL